MAPTVSLGVLREVYEGVLPTCRIGKMCQRASLLYLAGTFFFPLERFKVGRKKLSFMVTACAMHHTAKNPGAGVPWLRWPLFSMWHHWGNQQTPEWVEDQDWVYLSVLFFRGHGGLSQCRGCVQGICNCSVLGLKESRKHWHLGSEDHHPGSSFDLY